MAPTWRGWERWRGVRRERTPVEKWTAWDSRVGLKVSVVDGLDQLLRYLDDLLFASCRDGNKDGKRTANDRFPPATLAAGRRTGGSGVT